jgi:hypothetical protein
MDNQTIRYDKLPIAQSFDCIAGDGKPFVTQLFYGPTIPSAVVWSLTHSTWKLTVIAPDGTAPIDARTVTPKDIPNGKIDLCLSAADTAGWSGSYSYELRATFSEGDVNQPGQVQTFLKGTINATAPLTAPSS